MTKSNPQVVFVSIHSLLYWSERAIPVRESGQNPTVGNPDSFCAPLKRLIPLYDQRAEGLSYEYVLTGDLPERLHLETLILAKRGRWDGSR
jgi:hypothetical protein